MGGDSSSRQGVETSLKREQEHLDRWLRAAKDTGEVVPLAIERKREVDLKWAVFVRLPNDAAEEYSPVLQVLQQNDLRRTQALLPALPPIDKNALKVEATSASTFLEVVTKVIEPAKEMPQWAQPLRDTFHDLAVEKARKQTLPAMLDVINPGAGEIFSLAHDDVQKAKNGMLGVDQAASRMRAAIQQVWGGLVDHARQNCLNLIKVNRLELKNAPHRALVAKCLCEDQQEALLLHTLNDLYALYQDLSPTSKSPLTNDTNRLEDLYTRWILQLDTLPSRVALKWPLEV